MLFLPTLYDECNYLRMVRFKSIHVSKRGEMSSAGVQGVLAQIDPYGCNVRVDLLK